MSGRRKITDCNECMMTWVKTYITKPRSCLAEKQDGGAVNWCQEKDGDFGSIIETIESIKEVSSFLRPSNLDIKEGSFLHSHGNQKGY